MHFTGLPIQADDPDCQLGWDYDLLYFCNSQMQWLPVSHGFTIDEDEEPLQLDASY